jgi:signal transduction histidine kinase
MTYQLKIEKCAIEISLCDDECIICGDSDSILGAVINLLSNGIKYSAVPKKILVSMDKNDNAINVNFENKGSSFGEDEITKLTEPYFRTDSTKNKNIPGSGIGLTLVKQIISIHKGKFIVKNIPHSGCRFILSFPLEVKIEKDINN